MSPNKQDLFQILKDYDFPVSAGELKTHLAIPERTLRRWLADFVQQGVVKSIGEKKGRKYFIPTLPAAKKTQWAVGEAEPHPYFTNKSESLLAQVKAPTLKRSPCTYREAWLESYIPNQTFYLSGLQREILIENGRRLSEGMPSGTYAHKIFNRLLIDLSYNSSRLEGNTYSLSDTEQLVLQGTPVAGKLDRETLMIINHKEAIRFLVDGIHHLEITVENIFSLHFLLAEGLVAHGEAGKVRSDGVRITASVYLPLEGKERLERILNTIINKAKAIHDSYEQSFFLLVHIAYLQAFIDVNKRTSRLAANIPLVKHNLVPLSFNDISKEDYTSAMIVIYEFNDVAPLAELYVWSYLRTCKQYATVAEAVGIDVVRVLYRNQRRQLISEIVKNLICPPQVLSFVEAWANKIPEEDRAKFLADVKIDLQELAPFNIAGMSITQQELKTWQELCAKPDDLLG
jgi:hypothetical protein